MIQFSYFWAIPAPRDHFIMAKGNIHSDLLHNWFLLPSVILILTAAIVCMAIPRETIHVAVNSLHNPFMDGLFRAWTLLGSGLGALAVILITLLIRFRYTLILFAGYAIAGITVQLMKHLFFSHAARPVKYFELLVPDQELYLVPGIELHSWYGFPSGHTAAAFALFFGISLILKAKWAQLLALILATGVAYSRIYLSQHFLADVTGGAVVGMLSGYLAWWWIKRYDRRWLQESLPKIIRR